MQQSTVEVQSVLLSSHLSDFSRFKYLSLPKALFVIYSLLLAEGSWLREVDGVSRFPMLNWDAIPLFMLPVVTAC